jgi:RHS repeat-associated protein
LDTASGLYDANARWYDATTHQFTQPDPLGIASGQNNPYDYVGNDPTDNTDPSGLEQERVLSSSGTMLTYEGRFVSGNYYVSTERTDLSLSGLEVPGLDLSKADQFLALLAKGYLLTGEIQAAKSALVEVENEIDVEMDQKIPSQYQRLINARKELIPIVESLEKQYSDVANAYDQIGFSQLEVTGFSAGRREDLFRQFGSGVGFDKAVSAFAVSRKEIGPLGLTPTYPEADLALLSSIGKLSITAITRHGFRFPPRTFPANSITASEAAEIQAIAKKYNTTIDVVGSRAAGKGREIETNLPVGKHIDGGPPTRSDIDLRIDAAHPQAEALIKELQGIGNGAGTAGRKWSTNPATPGGRPTEPPFIRFTPDE